MPIFRMIEPKSYPWLEYCKKLVYLSCLQNLRRKSVILHSVIPRQLWTMLLTISPNCEIFLPKLITCRVRFYYSNLKRRQAGWPWRPGQQQGWRPGRSERSKRSYRSRRSGRFSGGMGGLEGLESPVRLAYPWLFSNYALICH